MFDGTYGNQCTCWICWKHQIRDSNFSWFFWNLNLQNISRLCIEISTWYLFNSNMPPWEFHWTLKKYIYAFHYQCFPQAMAMQDAGILLFFLRLWECKMLLMKHHHKIRIGNGVLIQKNSICLQKKTTKIFLHNCINSGKNIPNKNNEKHGEFSLA